MRILPVRSANRQVSLQDLRQDDMRSSSGAHFIALDHVRAIAVFMVIAWHLTHGRDGSPVPFGYVPILFPFSLLNEGHTGVALFMTLMATCSQSYSMASPLTTWLFFGTGYSASYPCLWLQSF